MNHEALIDDLKVMRSNCGEGVAMRDATLSQIIAALEQSDTEIAKYEKFTWTDGIPPKWVWDEWFIAKTIHRDRVVLTALPEEYGYDFTTADDTYMKKENITGWMQFPDSEFMPHKDKP